MQKFDYYSTDEEISWIASKVFSDEHYGSALTEDELQQRLELEEDYKKFLIKKAESYSLLVGLRLCGCYNKSVINMSIFCSSFVQGDVLCYLIFGVRLG